MIKKSKQKNENLIKIECCIPDSKQYYAKNPHFIKQKTFFKSNIIHKRNFIKYIDENCHKQRWMYFIYFI